MGTHIFLGKPSTSIEQWIKNQRLKEPLCFTAVDAGATIAFNKVGSPAEANIVTSTNGQIWQPYEFNTVITLENIGDKVYFRAADENDISFFEEYSHRYVFATTDGKRIAASGNIQTLMKADGSRLDISGKLYCYSGMFAGCTSLTSAPELPATTLADYCYQNMFSGCTSLISAPVLPATTLASGCYYRMFYNCRNLTSIDVSFTDWDTLGATSDWLRNVGDSGTFTCPAKLPDTRGEGYIPYGWTRIEK